MHPCYECGHVLTPRTKLDFEPVLTKLRSQAGPASVHLDDKLASILKTVDLDLEDYDAEIQHLKNRLSLLETERERLRLYSARHRGLLSPVRKIPNEILYTIIDMCCDMNSFTVEKDKTSYSHRRAPAIAVSSVCTRWRQIALALPAIWSRLSLAWDVDAVDASHGEDDKNDALPLIMCLERSLAYPLSVELHIDGWLLETAPCHPTIAKLLQQMARFRSYSFHSLDTLSSHLFRGLSSHFPLLEDLCLSADGISDSELAFFAGKTPKLKRLSQSASVVALPTGFPYAQLTTMNVKGVTGARRVQTILDKSSLNLVSLTIQDSFFPQKCQPEARTYPRLETLDVLHSFGFKGSPLYSFLQCPSLKTLRFAPLEGQSEADGVWDDFNPCMEFIRRSSFQLTTLQIDGLMISDSDLVVILTHVPTILNFTINDDWNVKHRLQSPITEQFVNSLHAHRTSSLRPQNEPLIPRLQSLIVITSLKKFNDVLFAEMVQSRWTPSASPSPTGAMATAQVDCLRSLTLKLRKRKKIESAVYQSLRTLEESGMRVIVSKKGQSGISSASKS